MERSFGIIPLRRVENRWLTLLVQHGKGHWAFPKGHPEPGETAQESATRELREETGLEVVRFFPIDPLKEFYLFKRAGALVEKMVTYFVAEVAGEVAIQIEEIADFRWLPLEEAAQRATFPESKALAQRVARLLIAEAEME